MIGTSHRNLPDNTQLLQEIDIPAPNGIRNRNPSNREAADARRKLCGHRDQLDYTSSIKMYFLDNCYLSADITRLFFMYFLFFLFSFLLSSFCLPFTLIQTRKSWVMPLTNPSPWSLASKTLIGLMMMNYTQDVMSYPKLEISFHYRKIAMAILKAIKCLLKELRHGKNIHCFIIVNNTWRSLTTSS